MDVTFKVAPTLSCQVYMILVEFLGEVHPAIYSLLSNKKETTYEKLFSMVNTFKSDLKPQSIACDFELGVIRAIKNSFEAYIYYQSIIMKQIFVFLSN
jgi:hypothetical protein